MLNNTRKARFTDLESIVRLFDAYRVFYHKTSDFEGATAFIETRLKEEDSVIFVVEVSGNIVGFTQLYPIFSSTRMQRLWLLNDLYIDTNFRGQGHSKSLINIAKFHAESTHAAGLLLETDKDNSIGNRLYQKEGFDLVHTNFYFWTNQTS